MDQQYDGQERRQQLPGEYKGDERRKAGLAGMEEMEVDEMATDQEPEPGPEQTQH
jgi:hypothetical protein